MASLDDVVTSLNLIVRQLSALSQSLAPASTTVSVTNYIYHCDYARVDNAVTLTVKSGQPAFTTLADGMRFTAIPTGTTPFMSSIVNVTIAGVTGGGPFVLYGPDGYAFINYGDLQLNSPFTVQYVSARSCFVMRDASDVPAQRMTPNGTVKLQAMTYDPLYPTANMGLISLDRDDGGTLLIWNAAKSAFTVQSVFQATTNSDVFAASNYVSGVANQALANNQLYAVYIFNTDSSNEYANALDFWPMFLGVGVAGWNPTLNEYGMYVKPTAPGGTSPDNTRTYVGMLWTGAGDIRTRLNGSDLRMRVQSHFNVWQFPIMSDRTTIAGFTTANNGGQATPIGQFVTEGILQTPLFRYTINWRPIASGVQMTAFISITGTAYDGSAFTASSSPMYSTSAAANQWQQIICEWGVAVPMGVFQCQISLSVSGSSSDVTIDLMVVACN